MKNLKLDNKQVLKIIVFVITFIVFREIISDWEHFKAGLAAAVGLN
jgi:hypothetical protein